MLQRNCSLIVLCSCFSREGCGKGKVTNIVQTYVELEKVSDGDRSLETIHLL